MENQPQNNKIMMELHPLEVGLIEMIRNKYQFGEILVECRNKLPYRIGKTIVYEQIKDGNVGLN